MDHYLYILRCSENNLYVDITKNLEKRFLCHKHKTGSKFTSKHRSINIVFVEKYNTYQEARKREIQIKKWRREKKENLIKFGSPIIID